MGSKKVNVLFLLDPLESLHGPLMPAYLVAKELKDKFGIVFVSPMISNDIAEQLASFGLQTVNLHRSFRFSGSLLTMEGWLRRVNFEPSSPDSLVVNFSQCFMANAHIYYAQGPMTKALDDLSPEMKGIYRLAYGLLRSYFVRRDKGFIRKLREKSKLVVANSNFCASMYENWGFRVDKVIYPPLDCTLFKPVASKPAGDYALTYAGKETKYSVLKKVAEAGVKIKMFGSKTTDVPKSLLKQPNMEFVGKVSESELVDLYSNALFTLSVFTHEPFGYIPVESMACGTPVLTYAKQGPAESVVNGQTGWFVENDRQLVDVASRLFRDSYPSSFRQNCRKRALDFDAKTISKEWLKLIDGFVEAM